MMRCFAMAAAISVCGFAAGAESHAADAAMEDAGQEGHAEIVIGEDVDLEAAEKTFKRNCRACHGNRAQGVASYPKLSDKDAEYIAEKLVIYRSGEKIGPNSVLMIQNAKDLSDEEIAGLSVYVTTAFD